MPARKTPMEWAYEHAGHLRRKANEIESGPANVLISNYLSSITEKDYQVGYWTILKNISLAYCLTPFGIILDRSKISNTVFLDPFSGSGIAPLKDPYGMKKSWTVGSPVISTMMTDHPFKSYIFGDISSRSIETLDNIFQSYNELGLSVSRDVIDANELIQRYCAEHQNKYVFAYLDQSGFQLNWESLNALLNLKIFDIILNFQTRLVERLPIEKKRTFFGPSFDKLADCANCDDILEVYIDEIKNMDRYVTPIRIGKDRSDQYYYHLLHISRKDSYLNIVNGLKSKIESFQGESIKQVWNDLTGFSQQKSLF